MKKNKSVKWTDEKLFEFYKNFTIESFYHATLNDPEMSKYLYALCFYYRGRMTREVSFKGFDEKFVKDVVKCQLRGFMNNCEKSIRTKEVKMFNMIFKDSDLYRSGGIFNAEEAIYAMRDEIMGAMIFQVLEILKNPEQMWDEFQGQILNLFTYDPEKHNGKKLDCYKRNFFFNYFGQMIIGTSMFFQHELNISKNDQIDDICEFDNFYDKFDNYFKGVIEDLGIDVNGEVKSGEFEIDNALILKKIMEKNINFYHENYELVNKKREGEEKQVV